MKQYISSLFNRHNISLKDIVVIKNSNLFIGGLTGRTGTTWLTELITELLAGQYVVINEHGTFVLSQIRGAAYEIYQVTPGSSNNRKHYLDYFYKKVSTDIYDRWTIYGNEGLRGLRSIVPQKAIKLAVEALRAELEEAKSLQEYNICFGNFYSRLHNYHSLAVGNTLNWISKEPSYGRHVKELWDMIPDCRIVIMVRDGRDTALSMAKKGWCDQDIIKCIDRWNEFTIMTVDSLQRVPTENYLLVKYEELITQFEATMAKILNFFGIKSVYELVTSLRKNNWDYAPLANNFNKWQTKLSQAQIDYFEKTCRDQMLRLGYEM